MENKEFYTIQEFAEVVGAAVVTVRTWIRQNKIKAEKTRLSVGFKEVWIIPKSEVSKVSAK